MLAYFFLFAAFTILTTGVDETFVLLRNVALATAVITYDLLTTLRLWSVADWIAGGWWSFTTSVTTQQTLLLLLS